MDGNKNLNPQLKEIYDRVMNTNIAPTANSAPQAPAPTPTTPAPTQNQPSPTPNVNQSAPPPPTNEGFVFSSKNKLQEVHSDVTPQTNVNGQPIPPQAEAHTTSTTVSHKGFLNGKIVVLLVIFIFVWTFFWLIFLGVIGA